MTRNSLYLVIAVLAVIIVGVAGYMAYEQTQKPALEIKVDGKGIKINGG